MDVRDGTVAKNDIEPRTGRSNGVQTARAGAIEQHAEAGIVGEEGIKIAIPAARTLEADLNARDAGDAAADDGPRVHEARRVVVRHGAVHRIIHNGSSGVQAGAEEQQKQRQGAGEGRCHGDEGRARFDDACAQNVIR